MLCAWRFERGLASVDLTRQSQRPKYKAQRSKAEDQRPNYPSPPYKSMDYIEIKESEGIATITLNRPEKLNAFIGHMRRDLAEALEHAASDR